MTTTNKRKPTVSCVRPQSNFLKELEEINPGLMQWDYEIKQALNKTLEELKGKVYETDSGDDVVSWDKIKEAFGVDEK